LDVVPSPFSLKEEERRQFHREAVCSQERKDTYQQSHHATQGIQLKGAAKTCRRANWTRFACGTDRNYPPGLKGRLKWDWTSVVYSGRMRSLESDRRRACARPRPPDVAKIKQLAMLRGIGPSGAWVLVREFFGWRTSTTAGTPARLQVDSTPFRSGALIREQGINKSRKPPHSRNRHRTRVVLGPLPARK